MKRSYLYFLLGAVVFCIDGWLVLGPWHPESDAALFFFVAMFALPNIGGFWMIYTVIGSERHPGRYIALVCLPCAFVWYYFERYRHGKHRTRRFSH